MDNIEFIRKAAAELTHLLTGRVEFVMEEQDFMELQDLISEMYMTMLIPEEPHQKVNKTFNALVKLRDHILETVDIRKL